MTNYIVVYGNHLKFIGGNHIWSKPRILKDETSEAEGGEDQNFHYVDVSFQEQIIPRRSDRNDKIMFILLKRAVHLRLLVMWISQTLE